MSQNRSRATIIYPHQLHRDHPGLEKERMIVLVEEYLFFRQYAFHKQKIILHRASMRAFADELQSQGYDVLYIDFSELTTSKSVFDILQKKGYYDFHIMDTVDDWLERAILSARDKYDCVLYRSPSQLFVTPKELGIEFFKRRTGSRQFFMADFYMWQRRRLHILVDDDDKPLGGQWSFDTENRKKLPKNHVLPDEFEGYISSYVTEAQEYVLRYFTENPGEVDFTYPITPTEAEDRFELFLTHRLSSFGDYEDAITTTLSTLYHSMLSSSLNIGLLSPQYVIKRTLEYAHEANTPLNSLEGFLRQIIGWREYVRIMYTMQGKEMRTKNFWKHTGMLDERWYQGTHGNPPLDLTIQKVLKTAYSHHVERLMIIGSAMLMNRIHPDEAYRWFMEMYIDAYDWVMVPNLYSMSQYADGGSMVTKPYLCGSNYILKMSDIPRGPWCEVWDTWYWSYIADFRDIFAKNPRMSMMVKILDKRGQNLSPTLNSSVT